VKPNEYAAIFYAGGHGAMWDFADNKALADIAARIYENKGIVGAVCHGPAGLVNIQLSDGKYLVDGKRINAFTNEEETAVGLEKVVPFALETQLIERGAKFEKSGLWQSHVAVDSRVVTGQNPQSAKAVGEAILKELNK
ncbi:MAG TPA: type 1 glutamine amidotransferase domain-containing protein, partial [Emticicia sp.]